MEQKSFNRKTMLCSVVLWGMNLMVGIVSAKLYSAEVALIVVMVILAITMAGCAVYFIRFRRKTSNEIMQMTEVDDLTGLPTKQHHKQEATRILNECKGKFAYVSCSIVDFKFLNETYGYAYGNQALKHISSVLLKGLKKNELLSRTTGDHLCMLLQYEKEEALRSRILQMLEEASEFPVDDKGGSHKAVFCCGVYLAQAGEDINVVRSRANIVRKAISRCFKSTVKFYSDEDMAKELEKKELEEEVQQALTEGRLEVYFQPKFDIASEKINGAEALVRWKHEDKGILPPATFVPLCEENGFICAIDFYMLEEVCKIMKRWKEEGRKLVKISVNFSRLHLSNENFVESLVRTVKKYGLEPADLEIELTESAAYEEMETLLEVMHQIKSSGFGLSMDDFGSGYSSLNLLREMPVDVLKLDKGFLDDCEGDSFTREKRIISHIISMAKDLEISVLAEGVETMQQKEFLKESNCDMIQGYYYARPMPADVFETYLEQVSA